MISFDTVLYVQGQLILLALFGYWFRRKAVGAEFQKGLSTVLVDLVLPCNILTSYQMELTGELLARSKSVLVIAVAYEVLSIFLAAVLFRKTSPDKRPVKQFGTINSNAGYVGLTVADGLWGPEGVFLTSIYLIPMRIVMWSVGVAYFTSDRNGGFLKKVLTNHCIDATLLGILMMIFHWRLPGVLGDAVGAMGRCTTGLSMFLIGMIISQIRWRDFLDGDVLKITFFRLAVLPALVLILCRLLHTDALSTGVSVILTAMPAGTSCALLASRYDKGAAYAAGFVTVSTLLSLVTIPLWGLILG